MPGHKLYALGMTLAVRADHNPVTGGYLHSAYYDDGEESDMIYTDVFFPECIAYGSTGAPIYMTDKVEVYSGAEKRHTRWEYPKHEYAIRMVELPAAEIAEIMNIWHICSGEFIAFLFMDPMDHTSHTDNMLLSGSDITPLDQIVPASETGKYEIYKYYNHKGHAKRRRIMYPKLDTLRVAVDGKEVSNFVYDYATGYLTFDKPIGTVAVVVTVTDGVFTGFPQNFLEPGHLVNIGGMPLANFNRGSGGNPVRVVSVDDEGGVVFEEMDGTPYDPPNFSSDSITLKSAEIPEGASITCGYWFWVPVRFDGADGMVGEITNGLRESAYANFTSIKLKEVVE